MSRASVVAVGVAAVAVPEARPHRPADRGMHTAYIGLGANLGQPAEQLRAAVAAIAALPSTRMLHVSRFFRSAPMGPADQPDYCNAACCVQTALAPRDLLAAMIAIERKAGRVRGGPRWGPRALDLDLLHVVGVVCDEPGLRLPHPGIAQRNFVLTPLAEVAPDLEIAGIGPVQERAATLGRDGLELWESDSPDARS